MAAMLIPFRSLCPSPAFRYSLIYPLVWASAKFRKFPPAATPSWVSTLIFHLHSPYKLILAHYEIQVHGCANLLIAHWRNSPAMLSSHDGALSACWGCDLVCKHVLWYFGNFATKLDHCSKLIILGRENVPISSFTSHLYSYRDTFSVYW